MFTEQEKGFLISLCTDIVPSLNVPAKDAATVLELAKSIADKLKGE